jgi:hypothetical protein
MNRISVNPDICSGKPCIKGTRMMIKKSLVCWPVDIQLRKHLDYILKLPEKILLLLLIM